MAQGKRISLLVPSRERPTACAEMITTALITADRPDLVEIILYLDSDDPTKDAYRQALGTQTAEKVIFHIGVPLRPIAAVNILGTLASGELINGCPDDLRFKSSGWDSALWVSANRFQDGIVCVFPDDGGRAGGNVCTQPFITKKARALLGYVLFPGCQHFGSDLWSHELFHQLERLVYVPEATIVHAHWDVGLSDTDMTAARANPLQPFDDAMFANCARWLPTEIALLRRHMRPTAQELAAQMR